MRAPTRVPLATLLLLAATASGCNLVRSTVEAPGRLASAAMKPATEPAPAPPEVVQARLMRYADLFAVEIEQASETFALGAGTPEAHIQALTWRIDYSNLLWRLASGPQAYASLFDSLIAVSLVRNTHETRWRETWVEFDEPMITALVSLEQRLWTLAGEVLPPKFLSETKKVVTTWLETEPGRRMSEVANLPSFTDLAGSGPTKGGLVNDLSNLVRVDPLAGLEPAVREIQQVRQMAERTVYYVQRQPEILSARLELLTLRASRTSEARATLESVERVSQAAASLAATAEALPASLATEREAALTQLSSELTAQREGLVADLEGSRATLVQLMEELRGTTDSGRAMATALTGTIEALDRFLARFDSPEEEAAETAAAPAPAADAPAARPFDVNEYGLAAERIGQAAHELAAAVATLDRSLPQVQQVLEAAATRTEQSLDHVWRRALQLVGATLLGVLALVLVLRRTRPRSAS